MVATINADTTNGVVITSDTSGEIELQANGVTKAKVTANGLQDANGASLRGGSFRNLIINGDMRIDQRNAGASVTANDYEYYADRWKFLAQANGKMSIQQVTDAPTGFSNSLLFTTTSAYTPPSSAVFAISQWIEGYNTAHLKFGTANAKTVTLSFWVKSSLTGTFGGALQNSAANRAYPFEYTISSANTWEQKTITVSGDTTGTWVGSTNGTGLKVIFSLGSGATFSDTAGVWSGTSNIYSATGAVQVVATASATWNVTGIQLEVGEGASDFEFLPYDVQLARCQRYYEKSYNDGTALGTATTTGAQGAQGPQGQTTTSAVGSYINFVTQKRTTPTIVSYDSAGASGKIDRVAFGAPASTGNTANIYESGDKGFIGYSASGAAAHSIRMHYTAEAEL